MPARTLSEDHSLDSIWGEVVFTEARLSGDANTQEVSSTFTDLRGRLEQVRSGQMTAWRDELVAQAGVSAADNALDDWVHALDVALTHVVAGDTESPRYGRYFTAAPSLIIRMGLENELGRVRGWADSLASEPEKELQDLGTKLRTVVAQGDAALEARRKTAAARTDHRVRSISTIIDDINNARLSLYGVLAKKAADLRLPRDWPDRFFQHRTRVPRPEPQPPVTNPPVAP
jgi:hypothetical protein